MGIMSNRILISFFLVSGGASFAATWSETNTGLPSAVPGVIALTVNRKTPSTLYARTTEGSVFKSTDGAATWRPLGSVAGVASLVVDPTTSSTVYASTASGMVLKSTNGGESWSGASSGLKAPFATLAIDPVSSFTLYATSYLNGVFKSTDGGGSWKALNGVPGNTFEIVIDPSAPSTIYAPAEVGSCKSTDGGETWSAIAAGPAVNTPVTALAIAPKDSSTTYLGYLDRVARGGAIIRTTDGGKSWSEVNAGLPARAAIRSIMIYPSSPSTVYITFHGNTGVGFLKST